MWRMLTISYPNDEVANRKVSFKTLGIWRFDKVLKDPRSHVAGGVRRYSTEQLCAILLALYVNRTSHDEENLIVSA